MMRAVIFDIGGTLIKTDTAILDAVRKALKENDIILKEKEKVIQAFGKSTHVVIVAAVEQSYSGSDIDRKIDQCWESFNRIFPRKVKRDFTVFPHVEEVLGKLKRRGVKLAIYTGFDRNETQFLLSGLKLAGYFDFSITKDDVKKVRPDPEALVLAINKLGVEKDECIYVGDTVADIQMAKNAKMKMVCVKTGIQENDLLSKEKPDYFVEDTKEMLEKLKNEFI